MPQGKVTSAVFTTSRIYPGASHDYKVYVPAQYTADAPAALMVFQDGPGYADPRGSFRVPVVAGIPAPAGAVNPSRSPRKIA